MEQISQGGPSWGRAGAERPGDIEIAGGQVPTHSGGRQPGTHRTTRRSGAPRSPSPSLATRAPQRAAPPPAPSERACQPPARRCSWPSGRGWPAAASPRAWRAPRPRRCRAAQRWRAPSERGAPPRPWQSASSAARRLAPRGSGAPDSNPEARVVFLIQL